MIYKDKVTNEEVRRQTAKSNSDGRVISREPLTWKRDSKKNKEGEEGNIKDWSGQRWEKVKRMKRPGTEAISTQIQPSKPKRDMTKITQSQNTKRTYGQPSEQLFPKR